MKRWEEKHQVLASEVDLMEECQRKSIVVVFGLEKKKKRGLRGYSGNNTKFSEGGYEAGCPRQGILCNQCGGRRVATQTGIRFVTCGAKVQLLRNGGQLRVCNISIDELRPRAGRT
jgi:hypothetical protein